MVGDSAALIAQVIATAAGSDVWEQVRPGLVRLFSRGHPEREQFEAQMLDETRQQLACGDSEETHTAQAERWGARIADLLYKYPSAEADILALVDEIQVQLRAEAASATPSPQGSVEPPIASPRPGREFGGRKAKLFISYSHRDDRYREQLVTHLAGLRRQGVIADWHDRKIVPGEKWRDEIDQNLDAADCVLLLVSADFLASDYCYSIEMQRTLEKHQQGRVLVIPVIVRPADWQHTPLADLQALPEDAKPVVEWPLRDRAWLSVTEGLRRALPAVLAKPPDP